MTIFKYIKDDKLYLLHKGISGYIAIPFGHNGHTISNPNFGEFIPVKSGLGSDIFI